MIVHSIIFATLIVISSYLALFCAIVMLLKKNKHISDYYLTTWLLVLSLFIFSNLNYAPVFATIGWLLSSLHGVFLFLYIKNITLNSRFQPKDLLHFIPPAAVALPVFFIDDYVFTQLFQVLNLLIFLIYMILSILMVRRYRYKVKEIYSKVEYADLSWLIILTGGLLFFVLNIIVKKLYSGYPGEQIEIVALFVFINITVLKAMLQAAIFIKQPTETDNVPEEHKVAYTNYGLKGPEAEILSGRLRKYMEQEKPHLNPALSLKDFALAMDTYPHYITQVLNTIFNQNFYDFVNHYRIEEAERQLADPSKKNLTILAIAFDCGFNSKATFNRVFKEKKGITPSEYKMSAK